MSNAETIKKSGPIKGKIKVPGDKSISHRALMLAALSDGPVEIEGMLWGEDPRATLDCLKNLGVKIEERPVTSDQGPGTEVVVDGCGGKFKKPKKPLDVGNSGTTIRILSGILAAQDFECEISGDESINQRPMRRIVEPLTQMGAKISGRSESQQLYPPLKISGAKLKGIKYKLPVASAQVKSSILLAGLFATGTTKIEEPSPARDHTERMLKHFGVSLARTGNAIKMAGGQKLKGKTSLYVPGDISSAAFFLVAAAIIPGSKLLIKNVGLNPTRTGIIEVMHRMGANVNILNEELICDEPIGEVGVVYKEGLQAVEIGGALIPRLIDEIPVIAVLATQAKGKTVIKDAKELRVKESDRIATVCDGLKKMGADITPTEDGMVINGPTSLRGVEVESHGDHRLAMALAIAAQIADGETKINNVDCVETSFPGFFTLLKKV